MSTDCHVEPLWKTATPEELQQGTSALLSVQGLGCPNCALRVRNSLLSVRGVVEAHVVHEIGIAEVVFNPNLTNVLVLIEAVARAGNDGHHAYSARLIDGPGVERDHPR